MPRKKLTSSTTKKETTSKQAKPRKSLISQDDGPMSESQKTLNAIESNRRQLVEMQNKILSAPAMNGGFSTLMYKIEKIEQSQEQLVEKVDEIRVVLYDPDNGLYARIKNVENESIDSKRISLMEDDIKEIKSWKDTEKKLFDKSEFSDASLGKKLEEHNEIIKDLQKWHQKQSAMSKWLIVTLGTSVLGMTVKFIYDYLISHVKFI
jgi:seryl-tRNA synthetase